jgi:EF hand
VLVDGFGNDMGGRIVSCNVRLIPLLLLLLLPGCNMGPGRIRGVDVNLDEAAEAIVGDYDKDGSGRLSEAELQSVPAIYGNRKWYDTDQDGEISIAELRAGLAVIFDPKIGLLSTWCNVTRRGKPLAGATVEFVPLPALVDVLPVARAQTDNDGMAKMAVASEDLPTNAPQNLQLVRPGLYFVKVTHDGMAIPDKYNTVTTLGKEISNHSTLGGPLKFDLNF